MSSNRHRASRFIAWLALWAMALHVVLPTLARAAVPLTRTEVVEICSAHGLTQTVAVDEAGNVVPDGGRSAVANDCPCCLTGGCAAAAAPQGISAPTFSATPLSFAPAPALGRVDPVLHWLSLLEHGPPAAV